jgi:hypothetical protein
VTWPDVVANLTVRHFPPGCGTALCGRLWPADAVDQQDMIIQHPVAGAVEAVYGTSANQEAADQPE